MKPDLWWKQKGREYVKKYLKIAGFRRIYEITFWLTHRCVYACKFCVIEENAGPFMPKEMVFSTIDAAKPYALDCVPITGGDPMLHPDFVEILHGVRDRVSNV